MKVLMCNKFHWPRGGSETVYFDNIRSLEAHGHKVAHFAMQDERNAPSEWSRYFVRNADYTVNYGAGIKAKLSRVVEAANVLYSFEAKRKMAALADDFQPDLAHVHNIYHQLSPSIFGPLKKRGIPVVMTLHDYKLVCPNHMLRVDGATCNRCVGGRFHHCVVRKCVKDSLAQSVLCAVEMYLHVYTGAYARGVDLFISPSEFLRLKMIESGWPAQRIMTLHNALDPANYQPNYEPGDYFLFVGRLDSEKGVMTLLDAAKQVREASVVIVGDGPMQDAMHGFVAEHNLTNVDFRGRLGQPDVSKLYRQCLALVLPSEWWENCPMTILEAFAHGKPALATRMGGIPELIDHEVDGFLCEEGRPDELARLMLHLWNNQSLASEMGKRGRKKLETRFSSDHYYDELIRLYRGLVPTWEEPVLGVR